ncbi:MAG: hypothetical protein FVQ83_01965 [Chloroflexi bacterium]|nr:hypothetical protein [Chloroflexota bacterium]
MSKLKKSESGQVMYLIAVGLIVMFGFVALAIDGGRIYSDRRKAQNTADTSAFAGALAIAQSPGGDPTSLPAGTINNAEAAIDVRSVSNNYDDDDPDVEVNVLITGPYSNNGYYYLVEVEIVSKLETTFAHLVFGGDLQTTVVATAKARPRQNIAFGYSMFGAAPSGCKAIWITGSSNTTIIGGGIFSNSSAASGSCNSAEKGGSGNTTITGGNLEAVGTVEVGGSGSITPAPTGGAEQQTLPDVPSPTCTGPNMVEGSSEAMGNFGSYSLGSGASDTITQGVYSEISVGSNADLEMEPGMYCITGSGGFSANGGSVDGDGIFIYLMDGGFDLGGNTTVNLFASTDLVDANGNQWAGMLVYQDEDQTEQIILTGSSGSTYRGTIYAIGPSSPETQPKCVIAGSSGSLGVDSQFLCYSIKITGTANVTLKYTASQNYVLPAAVELEF